MKEDMHVVADGPAIANLSLVSGSVPGTDEQFNQPWKITDTLFFSFVDHGFHTLQSCSTHIIAQNYISLEEIQPLRSTPPCLNFIV